MRVENAPADDERIGRLVKSGESVEQVPHGDSLTEECPYKKQLREQQEKQKQEEKKLKPPLRWLLWNIQEFGGGFYRPHERPDYEIAAYAAVVQKMKVDIAVILGLTDTIGIVPKADEDRVKFDTPVKDTGPAEAARLLKALGSTWKMEIPKPSEGDGYLYTYRTTTCILWNTEGGVDLESKGIADAPLAPALGLTGKLFCATFTASKNTDQKIFVAAPLGTCLPKREWAVPPEAGPEKDLKATIKNLPEVALIAVSAPEDLMTSMDFASFKAQMEATYRPPGRDGTTLKDQWWFPRADGDDGVLANFAALDPGDSLLQDDEMHWEGLEQPEYAENLEKVTGRLTDLWLLRDTGSESPPAIEELRVVDLIAAALTAGVLEKVRPIQPGDSKEDSATVDQRKQYRKEITENTLKSEALNEISDSAHFSNLLSDHWPVVLQLRFEK